MPPKMTSGLWVGGRGGERMRFSVLPVITRPWGGLPCTLRR